MEPNRGRLFFKGFLIGATMSVPGASGGTMAMLLGVYEGALAALSGIFRNFRQNALFLLLLGGGGLLGMLSAAGLVEEFLFFYPFQAGFFFAGCIAGGIPFLLVTALRQAGKRLFLPLTALLVGAGAGILLPLCPGLFRGEGVVFLFFAGLLLALALVLPGISASSFLYILGLYEPLLAALRGMELGFLLPVGAGCALGSFFAAGLFSRALQKHPAASHLLIAGFLIASAAESLPYGVPGSWYQAGFAFVLGGFPMFALSGGASKIVTLFQRRKRHANLSPGQEHRYPGSGEAPL